MTDLIAELAEVVSQLRSYDDKSVVGVRLSALSESAVQFIRAHHVELTRILTDDAAIRAAHHDLVIRLGEVTTMLEAERARIAEAPAGTLSASLIRVELRDADMNALPLNGKRVALVVLEDGK
jgi:hypothetical protein